MQAAEKVPDEMFGTQELYALVARMVAAMREAPGVGLAAPQIGTSLQVSCSTLLWLSHYISSPAVSGLPAILRQSRAMLVKEQRLIKRHTTPVTPLHQPPVLLIAAEMWLQKSSTSRQHGSDNSLTGLMLMTVLWQ